MGFISYLRTRTMLAPDQESTAALARSGIVHANLVLAGLPGGKLIHVNLETVHEHHEYPTHKESIAQKR